MSASFVFTQQYLTLIRKIVTFDFCLVGVGKRVQRPQHDGEEEAEADIVFSKKDNKRKKEKKATGAEKKSKGSSQNTANVVAAPEG